MKLLIILASLFLVVVPVTSASAEHTSEVLVTSGCDGGPVTTSLTIVTVSNVPEGAEVMIGGESVEVDELGEASRHIEFGQSIAVTVDGEPVGGSMDETAFCRPSSDEPDDLESFPSITVTDPVPSDLEPFPVVTTEPESTATEPQPSATAVPSAETTTLPEPTHTHAVAVADPAAGADELTALPRTGPSSKVLTALLGLGLVAAGTGLMRVSRERA